MTAAGDESRHSEGQLAALCPQLTATSLNLPPDMRFPIWEQLGEALARAERSLLWYLADWWVWAREKRLPPEEILKLPRFRGHRTIWVRGVYDGQDKSSLPA